VGVTADLKQNTLGFLTFCHPYRVFGWRAGRVGSEWTHSRGCLVRGWEGWVGSRVEYSSQMRVGLVRQNLTDGAAPAGLMFTKHWIPSTKQSTEPAPSPILQPNTETGWVYPKNQSATKHSFGLAPSKKTGLDPIQPTQPQTKHTVMVANPPLASFMCAVIYLPPHSAELLRFYHSCCCGMTGGASSMERSLGALFWHGKWCRYPRPLLLSLVRSGLGQSVPTPTPVVEIDTVEVGKKVGSGRAAWLNAVANM
jgi:hypothetical protein